jgi:hypothetical protein
MATRFKGSTDAELKSMLKELATEIAKREGGNSNGIPKATVKELKEMLKAVVGQGRDGVIEMKRPVKIETNLIISIYTMNAPVDAYANLDEIEDMFDKKSIIERFPEVGEEIERINAARKELKKRIAAVAKEHDMEVSDVWDVIDPKNRYYYLQR